MWRKVKHIEVLWMPFQTTPHSSTGPNPKVFVFVHFPSFSMFPFFPTLPHFDLCPLPFSWPRWLELFVSWLLSLRNDRDTQTTAKKKKENEFHICSSHFLASLPACYCPVPTKVPQVHTATAVCEFLLKSAQEKHMVWLKLAHCGLLLTRGPARTHCLLSPVAKLLNIKNDVAYRHCC